MLYNMKCQQLKDKDVLICPTDIGIQPVIINNSWITWKPSASRKPLEQCTVNDVHLVMGFNLVNKYLQDPPDKVTTHAAIYSNLAKWWVMGKLNFSDIYHQIKFKTNMYWDKCKLGYKCIHTVPGTLAYSCAPMGLLEMDIFQDELMDLLFRI